MDTATYNLRDAHKGSTLINSSGAAPLSVQQPCLLLLSRSDPSAEFRLVLANQHKETRGAQDVLCFAIGQDQNTVAALGLGNPHIKVAASGNARDTSYRHCVNDRGLTGTEFWILCDAESGWVALGYGDSPSPGTALLTSRFDAAARPSLGALSCAMVSNWQAPVAVSVRSLGPDAARRCVAGLQTARNKFDIDGNTIPIRGLTAVCELPAAHGLHLVMSRVRDALAAEPALAASHGLLPPDSYHMTVFDIISGAEFEREAQADAAARDADADAALQRVQSAPAPWQQMTAPMQRYTASVALKCERGGVLQSVPWTSFAMRAVCIDERGTSIEMEPWDETVGAAIDAWRERVAACTGQHAAPTVRSVATWKQLKPRGQYRFHMTVAYVICPLGCSVEATEARQRVVAGANALLRSLGPVVVSAPHFVTLPPWPRSTLSRCLERL
tara:strand:- start:3 stop:1334 length:1332 start_codon:yes stop_codon:yes gene_type:complete